MISLPPKLYTINIRQPRTGNQVYRKYFTSSLNEKQCIFSFKDHSVATDCTVFLAHYKNKFHEYPVINNSNVIKVDSNDNKQEYFNNSIANILANEIEIVEDSGEEILSVCSLFGMGLIILENFSFIQHSGSIDLMFSGEECNIEPNINQNYNEKSLIDYLDSLIN